MASKTTNLRVPTDLLSALRDAVATGEGLAEAAAAVARCEDMAVTIFDGPHDDGMIFRVPTGKYPLNLVWPCRSPDGDIVIPVRLHWYKGLTLAEARGTDADARELIERLQALLDG